MENSLLSENVTHYVACISSNKHYVRIIFYQYPVYILSKSFSQGTVSKLAVTGTLVHFGAHRLGYLLNFPSRQPDRLCRHCVGFTILDEHLPVLQAEGKGEMPGYVTRSPSKGSLEHRNECSPSMAPECHKLGCSGEACRYLREYF